MTKKPIKRKYHVQQPDGSTRKITVYGREAWALSSLIKAGPSGCTPIDHPGPRWSAYVHDLRHEFGLNIETVTELHGGPFPGHHARYRLLYNVLEIEEVAA